MREGVLGCAIWEPGTFMEGKGGVLKGVFAGFYAGLGFGVAVQASDDHLCVGFGLCELCFCLSGTVSEIPFYG